MTRGNCLFLGTEADAPYMGHIKPMLSSFPNTYVILQDIQYLVQITDYCKRRNVRHIISTNKQFLWKLLEKDWPAGMRKRPSIDDYAGSMFPIPGIPEGEVLFIDPVKQILTVPHGKFIAERYISKLTNPGYWYESTEFNWQICKTAMELQIAYGDLQRAIAIACDIETTKENLAITCSGYTGIFVEPDDSIITRSYVIPCDSMFALTFIRKINACKVPKIFQNGKYDNAYFLRYAAPITNWLWDTAYLMHAWYSELPKDLAFINAFFLRQVQYWKDLSKTGDKYLYYKYNALDHWATANVWLIQMLRMPAWARKNYLLKFPNQFAALLSEMTGVRRDPEQLQLAVDRATRKLNNLQSSLNRQLGVAYFNTNSPKQMAALFKVLGLSDYASIYKNGEEKESTGEIIIKKAMLAHPFGRRILQLVLDIRAVRKEISTYLITGEKAKEYNGRILYSINPHGADTGRNTSRESSFWCGFNIQTAPTEGDYKSTIGADAGFRMAEADLSQAESRDVANISGDNNLLNVLSSDDDFHSRNASAFFGIPYEQIFDNRTRKKLDTKLRNLSKRTNHGATYVMGEQVLADTMGYDKVYEAQILLRLPAAWDVLKITGYLLQRFHFTYPGISKTMYPWIMKQVNETGMIVSRAMHHVQRTAKQNPKVYIAEGDWTRYCFGKPNNKKHDFNRYAAHPPQSLNARTLDEAYMQVFYDLALGNPEFRLYAQIHDSILFGFMVGTHDKYLPAVKKRMEIPITILGADNVYRTFTVPADIKAGKDGTGALFWSETE